MFKNFEQFNNKKGAIALLLVIMITTLTLVSSIVLSMVNTSDMMSNYHISEATNVNVGIDSCIDEALYRISSNGNIAGTYNINLGSINCEYDISATANGFKQVTTTAYTTSSLGSWNKTVTTLVNVSTSPISIDSYKDAIDSYDSFILPFCGDGNVDDGETCDDGNTTTETQTCGNNIVEGGTYCNSDCSTVINLTETCDEGDVIQEGCTNGIQETAGDYCNGTCTGTTTIAVDEVCDENNSINEGCGNGIAEDVGTYCRNNCTATIVISVKEICDYTGGHCGAAGSPHVTPNTCKQDKFGNVNCADDCSLCAPICF